MSVRLGSGASGRIIASHFLPPGYIGSSGVDWWASDGGERVMK